MIMIGTGFIREGGGILFPVAPKLAGDSEVDGAKGVFSNVRAPQLGERLAHRADGVFHRSRSDGFMQGRLASVAVPLGKDLDDGDWFVTVSQERVDCVRETEFFPADPMRIRCFGSFSSDTKSGFLVNKAEISAESVSFRTGHICQGIVCGKDDLKWAMSWESAR
jgi:hypothetical protein